MSHWYCCVTGNVGRFGEPVACAYNPGHDGDHSWASLPTFVDGLTVLERAAREYIEAGRAEAERVVRTGKATDPKSPEWERKFDAHLALIAALPVPEQRGNQMSATESKPEDEREIAIRLGLDPDAFPPGSLLRDLERE